MKYLVGIVHYEINADGGKTWIDALKDKSGNAWLSEAEIDLLKLRQVGKLTKNYQLADDAKARLTDDGIISLIDHKDKTDVWFDIDGLKQYA